MRDSNYSLLDRVRNQSYRKVKSTVEPACAGFVDGWMEQRNDDGCSLKCEVIC